MLGSTRTRPRGPGSAGNRAPMARHRFASMFEMSVQAFRHPGRVARRGQGCFVASVASTHGELGVSTSSSTIEQRGGVDTGNLETDLGKLVRDSAEAAAERRVGLATPIAEAQDLTPDDLIAVSATAHAAGQRDCARLFALAGITRGMAHFIQRQPADSKSW